MQQQRQLVENWLWWAVFSLAKRRNPDVELAIRTAHKAMIRQLVENWLWWAVFSLAKRRNPDVELAIRTAHKAMIRFWSTYLDDE